MGRRGAGGEAVRGGRLRWGEAWGEGWELWEQGPGRGEGWRQNWIFSTSLGKRNGAEAATEPGNSCCGEGRELDPIPPPRRSVERAGCGYLVAPTLRVHEHQQGLHEGGRGGPDDEGSPAALLGDTESP